MTREQAIDAIRTSSEVTPHSDLEEFCAYLGISKGHALETAEHFRNRKIWSRRPSGVWEIPDFLIADWSWT